jgi:HlyD family secretion protein
MHSAPAALTPEPESPPDQPGTPAEPSKQKGARPHGRRGWMVVAAMAVVFGIILLVVIRSKTPAPAKQTQSAASNPGQVLRLKGTTEAVQSRAILAPLLAGQQVSTLTIIRMASAGTKVQKGDLLVEFDRQAQMRDFVDKQAEFAKLVDQVAEEQAKENAARAKDETELKAAEDNLRKAELEIQKAEIVSKIDGEKNQENLDEAKATYEQLRETFDLKRKAALAAVRILEIQRDRTQQTMTHAQANADLMQIHSPLDGVVVNPAAMQVRVLANQQDFPSLQVGQRAKVRLDAYPEMVFPARLEQVAPIGEGGDFSSKLRSFVVIVSIEGNDPKLMPDLSAAVDVEVAKQNAGSYPGSSALTGAGSGS